MEILKIIISGIIDGLTGFLPISSSGHMVFFRNVLGFGPEPSVLFDTFLKLASILVILLAFSGDIRKIFSFPSGGSYRNFTLMLVVSTISTAIVGCAGRELARFAESTVLIPAILMVATGVMLFLTGGIPKGRVSMDEADLLSAFIIGGVQGLSVMPGLARCGMVIACCLLFGYDRKLTWKFTFLSALIPLAGGVVLNIVEMAMKGVGDFSLTVWYILASLLAVVTGYIGLIFTRVALKKNNFMVFAIYCLVLGAVMLASMIVL